MKSNIFVPKIINVGYQNRKDTYTGKLAYVVYTDEKGTLRKEASWNSWRDENISTDTFDNVPTSGFVLNKKVGDTCSHWNFRQAYCRIYDPRGFEFEITIENLLYILENTNSIVGKGLEGDFVYGWDGKDLVLLPTNSSDYKEIQEYNNLMFSETNITPKDLVIGQTYRGKDNTLYLYLGKYDTYSSIYDYNEVPKSKGKHFWFAHFSDESVLNNIPNHMDRLQSRVMYKKTLSSKFLLSVYDSNTSPYLSDFIETIKRMPEYSPVDLDRITLQFIKKESFIKSVKEFVTEAQECRGWNTFSLCSKPYNNTPNNYVIKPKTRWVDREYQLMGFEVYKYSQEHYNPRDYYCAKYTNNNHPIHTFEQLTEENIIYLWETYRPCYIELYLKNGEYYKTVYEYRPLPNGG